MNYLIIGIGLIVAFVSFFTGKDPVFWVVAGILLAVFGSVRLKKQNSENEFFSLPFVKTADHKWCYDNTAIAISKKEGKILLGSPQKLKLYDFAEIRSWEYKLYPTVSTAARNTGELKQVVDKIQENVANSGFFVSVADIDFPRWRIAFDLSKGQHLAEQEMLKWMEIFRQYVKNQ